MITLFGLCVRWQFRSRNFQLTTKFNKMQETNNNHETANGTKPVLGEGLIEVEISKVLCYSGWKPFVLTCRTHKLQRAYEKWNTLAELKHYYEIKKVIKTKKKEFAISPRGTKYEWFVYKAYVDPKFVL